MTISAKVKLGSLEFHGWTGWVPTVSNLGESFARIGQPGSGSQITGTRGAVQNCSAWIACASKQAALDAAAAVEALAWLTVKMVSQWGTADNRARVRISSASCKISQGKGTLIAAGAPMVYLVECQISLEVLP